MSIDSDVRLQQLESTVRCLIKEFSDAEDRLKKLEDDAVELRHALGEPKRKVINGNRA